MTDRELKERMRQALDRSMPPLPDDSDLTAKVLGRHAGKQQKKRARRNGLRIAAAAMVMVLVIFGGAIMQCFSYTYVDARQSEDGEQYVLIGVSVTPNVDQGADAEIGWNKMLSFSTKDWDQVVEVWGGVPLTPCWLPDGYEIYNYSISMDNTMKRLVMNYHKDKPGEEDYDVLIYTTRIFTDLQYFYMTIEANNEGEYIKLDNGLSVYVDMNVERPTSMWRDGLTGYSMSGDITSEDLVQIIRAMYGSD